ncbi:vWA domain-containing protein [Streptomyces sp. NPDC050504]|uniref:vWA domain-containing protein n=1 Tax=Streptomyces sp. NPDC050504 TaxID=3365618 RepID=UPI0037A99CC8
MTFHVYPDPQVEPLQVASAQTRFASIDQLTGASNPIGYTKMMFIRVCVTGAVVPPTFLIKAGAGTEVAIGPLTAGVFNDAGATGYVGDVIGVPEPDSVTLIRMGFDQDSAETWQLGFRNNNAAGDNKGLPVKITWTVAQSAPETAQPWLDVTPGEQPFVSLINGTDEVGVKVFNYGTAALDVGAVGGLPQDGFSAGVALPLTVRPAHEATLPIAFAAPATPPATGKVELTADLTVSPPDTTVGTAPGHNRRLALSGTTQRLEVVLLLDSSGSMSWDPLGPVPPVPKEESRWGELTTAAQDFLNMLAHFGHGGGKLGIARFPAAGNPASFDVLPVQDIPDLAGMADVGLAIAAVDPIGGTPMGDGLDHVLAPGTTFFATDPVSVNTGRRWLILMSDGAHNSGTHNPLEFIAPPIGSAPLGSSLAEKKISLFSVAYGIEGATDVDHILMKTLSTGSVNGQIRNVDGPSGITPHQLALALREPLKAGLTKASSPADPEGLYVFDGRENLHEAVITPYDTKAAFVLNWNTSFARRLRLELLTPSCERITPENAGSGRFAQVTFKSTDRSHMYLIDPDFLCGGGGGGSDDPSGVDGGSRRRYGTWRLVVTEGGGVIGDADSAADGGAREDARAADAQGGPDTERYVYDVLVDSTLRLQVSPDRDTYFAGDPITLTGRLTAGGRPVTGAAVSVSTTAPAQSVNNQIAALRVPPEFIERAKEILAGQDATPLLVKQLGARLAGLDIDGGVREDAHAMSDPFGTGEYQVTLTDTAVPEQRTFYVSATGITPDGVVFHREAKQETLVQVRPEPEHTRLDVRQTDPGIIDVTVTPRDRFGNVVLVNPDTTGGFGLTVLGGRADPLTSGLDGTYGSTVTFDPKVTPAIGLQFGGRDVIVPKPAPPIGDLRYVNRVVEFEPGAIKSANQHADACAVLGTVVGKPADTFVSLGAFGVLTVTVERMVIMASGRDDDITVFVRPDTDPRSYRVEAYAVEKRQWVALGDSAGETKSFGLRAARLKFTLAVRVVDTSGRTRDAAFQPLTTPGVSVRGIGALKTGKKLPCRLDQLPDWFPWPLTAAEGLDEDEAAEADEADELGGEG